jgi:hypothetical protein
VTNFEQLAKNHLLLFEKVGGGGVFAQLSCGIKDIPSLLGIFFCFFFLDKHVFFVETCMRRMQHSEWSKSNYVATWLFIFQCTIAFNSAGFYAYFVSAVKCDQCMLASNK